VRRSPHHEEYIAEYLKKENLMDVERLSQQLGENIKYRTLQKHFREHMDFTPEWQRRQKELTGYCVSWASQNAVMIGILENFGKIFSNLQDQLEAKFQSGEIKDGIALARDVRALLKELAEYEEELAQNPLVSIDTIYETFLPKIAGLCPACREKLLKWFEDDLKEIRNENPSIRRSNSKASIGQDTSREDSNNE